MTLRRIVKVVVLLALVLPSPRSEASSELHKNVTVGLVGELVVNLNAGSVFDFRIVDTGADAYQAIIDVFSYPSRALLHEARPSTGEVFQTAAVTLQSASFERAVYVVIRPLPGSSPNVTLRVTRIVTGTPTLTGSRDFLLSLLVPPTARVPIGSGLALNTHVWTTRENASFQATAGTYDTVLMVLQDDTPIAFDDDSGVARMSWLHLYQPCVSTQGHTCEILMAQRINDKGGRLAGEPGYEVPSTYVHSRHATLVWDEDNSHGNDRDQDGLGDALEVYIGTCPDPGMNAIDSDGDQIPDCNDPDVDGDGIPDVVEVIGVADEPANEETSANLTQFPYYGADPLKPDLFVEMDWVPGCDPAVPTCTPVNREINRFAAAQEALVASIFPPEMSVHIDGGHEDPAGGTAIGDWGGASFLGWAEAINIPDGYCTGMSETRKGYFSHLLATFHNPQNSGRCSAVQASRPSATAHEMGHYFHLGHAGAMERPNIGCTPSYISIMNYAYSELAQPDVNGITWLTGSGLGAQLPAFSRGAYAGVTLNPFHLNELAGLGTGGGDRALPFLNAALGLKVDVTSGAVDWNRNGRLEAGLVTGMVNAPGASGGDCDPSAPVQRAGGVSGIGMPTLAVVNGSLQLFGLTPVGPQSGGVGILVGSEVNVADCAVTEGITPCATLSASVPKRVVVPWPSPGLFAPAVAGGLVVFADASGKMSYFDAAGTVGDSVPVFPVGGPAISGDPAAVQRPSGMVSVYAPSGGNLLRWDYHPGLKTWTALGVQQFWAPAGSGAATPISALAGVGLTWGYQRSLPGEPQLLGPNLYVAVLTQATGGTRTVALARLDGDEGPLVLPVPTGVPMYSLPSQWIRFEASQTGFAPQGANLALSRVGLAFRPEEAAAPIPQAGRFYVTWQVEAFDGFVLWENRPEMAYTTGNVFSAVTPIAGLEEAFVFNPSTQVANAWTSYASGLSLAFFDGAVRAVAQTAPSPAVNAVNGVRPLPVPLVNMTDPVTGVFPNVDGVFLSNQTDFDDVSYMLAHMSWAVRQ